MLAAPAGPLRTNLKILFVNWLLITAVVWPWRNSVSQDDGGILHGPIREVITQKNINQLYPNADLMIGANPVTGAPKVYFSAVRSPLPIVEN